MKQNTIYIMLGIIVLAVIVGLGTKLGNVYQQGLEVNSISYLPSGEWLIDTTANGYGQSIIANLDSSEIAYNGMNAHYPLEIRGNISKNQALYIISNDNAKVIKKLTASIKEGRVERHLLYTKIIPAPACDGNPAYRVAVGAEGNFLGFHTGQQVLVRFCFYANTVGVVAPISSSPNIIPTINLKIASHGITQTVKLRTRDSVPLGDFGSVTWSNSPLEAGSSGALSIGNQYIAVQDSGKDSWHLAYRNDYEGGTDSYSTAWSNGISLLNMYQSGGGNIIAWHCTDSNQLKGNNVAGYIAHCGAKYLSTITAGINNKADTLMTGINKINIDNHATDYKSIKSGNAYGFLVDLGNIYASSPHLLFRIASGWIGVEYPNGIPQVINTTCTPYPFKSGEPLTIDVKVKNIGNKDGNFLIAIDNCGSLRPQFTTYPVSVGSGKETDIFLKAVTTGSSVESGTCSGRIIDTGSHESSAWSCHYQMERASECTEGQLYYSTGSTVIQKCVDGKLINWKTCKHGVVLDSQGKYTCRTVTSNGSGSSSGSGGSKHGFPILLWLPILGFIGGFIYVFIINGGRPDKRTLLLSLLGGFIFMLVLGVTALLIKELISLFGHIFSLFRV